MAFISQKLLLKRKPEFIYQTAIDPYNADGWLAARCSRVFYLNGLFIFTTHRDSPGIFYSSDGVNLVERPNALPSWYGWSGAYGAGLYLLISTNEETFGRIAYTTNPAINAPWTTSSPLPRPAGSDSVSYDSIAFGNSLFVATQSLKKISGSTVATSNFAYSSNGTLWTQGNMPSSQYWSDVIYAENKFVSLSGGLENTANVSNVAAYSNDGINWSQSLLPYSKKWTSIAYGNGVFCANGLAYSNDGITWNATNIPSTMWFDEIIYTNKFLGFIASSGKVYYSNNGSQWFDGGYAPEIYFRGKALACSSSELVAVTNSNNYYYMNF